MASSTRILRHYEARKLFHWQPNRQTTPLHAPMQPKPLPPLPSCNYMQNSTTCKYISYATMMKYSLRTPSTEAEHLQSPQPPPSQQTAAGQSRSNSGQRSCFQSIHSSTPAQSTASTTPEQTTASQRRSNPGQRRSNTAAAVQCLPLPSPAPVGSTCGLACTTTSLPSLHTPSMS